MPASLASANGGATIQPMNAKDWERRVEPHFGYLRTEFGCEVVEWSDENWWETSITYQNSTTAIKVACSEEFDRLVTDLIRLVHGARPPTVVFVSESPKLHKFGLGNLLMIRAPELWSELKEQKGQSDDAIETQLRSQAKALREFGSDILRGDFSSFVEMEARVRAIARDMEGITIWSPNRGDSAALADTIAKIRTSYPTVPIATGTYQRPTQPVEAGTHQPQTPPIYAGTHQSPTRRTFRDRVRSLLRLIAGEVD